MSRELKPEIHPCVAVNTRQQNHPVTIFDRDNRCYQSLPVPVIHSRETNRFTTSQSCSSASLVTALKDSLMIKVLEYVNIDKSDMAQYCSLQHCMNDIIVRD